MGTFLSLIVSRFMVPALCLVGLFAVLGIIYRGMPTIPQSAISPADKKAVPERQPQTYEELKGQYMAMVSSGEKKLGKFRGAKYRGSERVKDELMVFQAWAVLINEMPRYPLSDSEKETVRAVARRLSAIQRNELPAMRADFATFLRRALKEHGTIAYCSGERRNMLHVIAPPGTSQEGLEKCLELLMSETCAQLRFSKIDFTFTGDQTMTAPVKPSKQRPPADGELVFWRENITNRSSGRNRKESRNGCDRIRFPVAA